VTARWSLTVWCPTSSASAILPRSRPTASTGDWRTPCLNLARSRRLRRCSRSGPVSGEELTWVAGAIPRRSDRSHNEHYGEWPAFLALIVAEGRPRGLASFRGLSGPAMPWGTTIPSVSGKPRTSSLSLFFPCYFRCTSATFTVAPRILLRAATRRVPERRASASDNQAPRTGPPLARACARTGRKIPQRAGTELARCL